MSIIRKEDTQSESEIQILYRKSCIVRFRLHFVQRLPNLLPPINYSREYAMQQKMKLRLSSFFYAIFVVCLFIRPLSAQENANVKEPPVPVYVLSPYHEDSLSDASTGITQAMNQANDALLKKLDTLQLQTQKSSAESTAHFIWLYTLIALLGIMNIILLVFSSHLKKDLVQLRHAEHQRLMLEAEAAARVQQPQMILETPTRPEPRLLQAPRRIRKPATTKIRSKKKRSSQ